MTEENHCYNTMAERVNGILKDEFYLDQTFASLQHAKRATKNAINLYNEIRLHLSLDFKTPNMVYLKNSINQLLTCSHISGLDIKGKKTSLNLSNKNLSISSSFKNGIIF